MRLVSRPPYGGSASKGLRSLGKVEYGVMYMFNPFNADLIQNIKIDDPRYH